MQTKMQTKIQDMSKKVIHELNRRNKFYRTKLQDIVAWTTSRCEMNGTSPQKIRQILSHALGELGIPQEKVLHILGGFYSNLREFDASRFISNISNSGRKYYEKEHIYDLFNKNTQQNTVDTFLDALEISNFHFYSSASVTALCVFTQCILMGARGENEGFGSAPNIVEIAKSRQATRIAKIEHAEAQKRAIAIQESRMRAYYNSQQDEEDEEDEKDNTDNSNEKLENEQLADSWEDLLA